MKFIDYNSYTGVNIDAINHLADTAPEILVNKSEENYIQQLKNVVNYIREKQSKYCIILLAGPTASGKTTTAHKLCQLLNEQGTPAQAVSLDDFYKGHGNYPLREDGTDDYESIYGLDIDLINACFKELMETGQSIFPRFDFVTIARIALDRKITLPEGGVLVVEGIHALNPLLCQTLPEDCIIKVYVSVRTKFSDENGVVFTPKNIRLMRRMVRDKKFRNHSPVSTLERWDSVLEGETLYINPFRDDVDIKIDSTLDYEVCILNNYLLPLLSGFNTDSIHYDRIQEIYESLSRFCNIDEAIVPENSLIREFIG